MKKNLLRCFIKQWFLFHSIPLLSHSHYRLVAFIYLFFFSFWFRLRSVLFFGVVLRYIQMLNTKIESTHANMRKKKCIGFTNMVYIHCLSASAWKLFEMCAAIWEITHKEKNGKSTSTFIITLEMLVYR